MSDRLVERVRIDPKINIVQTKNKFSELEPTPSEMAFNVNKTSDLNYDESPN